MLLLELGIFPSGVVFWRGVGIELEAETEGLTGELVG